MATYVITLRARGDIHWLRHVLKLLLRRYGLRAIAVEEDRTDASVLM